MEAGESLNISLLFKEIMDEFDALVDECNRRLEYPKLIRKTKVRAFFKGMASAIDIFGSTNLQPDHPIYRRNDFTPAQKDAVMLASDLKRLERTLDNIIETQTPKGGISPSQAREIKPLVEACYNHYKAVYNA